MSTLAITYLHLDFDLSNADIEEARAYLDNVARRYAVVVYRQDVDIRVELYHGSVKVWIAIAGSIYLAIGQYGSFRTGVDQIIKDAKSFNEYFFEALRKDGVDENKIIDNKRRQCLPDRIRRVFLRIDRFERHLADLSKDEQERESKIIVRAVARIADELDYKEDFD